MKNESRVLLTLIIGIFGLLSAIGIIDMVNKFPFLFTEFDIEYHLYMMIFFILGSLLSVLSIFAVKFNLKKLRKV